MRALNFPLILGLTLTTFLCACSGSGGGGASSGSSNAGVVSGASESAPPVTPAVVQQQEIAQLQQDMAQEPEYQISTEELGTLAEEGAITQEEQDQLTQLFVQSNNP